MGKTAKDLESDELNSILAITPEEIAGDKLRKELEARQKVVADAAAEKEKAPSKLKVVDFSITQAQHAQFLEAVSLVGVFGMTPKQFFIQAVNLTLAGTQKVLRHDTSHADHAPTHAKPEAAPVVRVLDDGLFLRDDQGKFLLNEDGHKLFTPEGMARHEAWRRQKNADALVQIEAEKVRVAGLRAEVEANKGAFARAERIRVAKLAVAAAEAQ